jgi:pimeloyl-ACP methyl ester carboxylesterase
MKLACSVRHGSPVVVVFFHGLGDARTSFTPLFGMSPLEDLTLAAVDLPGCGESTKPVDFSYGMGDQASQVLQWLGKLNFEKVILAGHSMGGVVALYAAENLPQERVAGLVNIEGNLGPEDCFYSRNIASYSGDDFEKNGFKAMIRMLRMESSSDPQPVMERYARNFSNALPCALHRSSVSLVEESDHGRLKERFRDLPMAKGYISGERSLVPSTAKYLADNRITYLRVPKSGHFMMVEQPEAFCEVFRRMLEEMGIIG